ncbi:hypothetical protein D3C80_2167520 [compost metagenome]
MGQAQILAGPFGLLINAARQRPGFIQSQQIFLSRTLQYLFHDDSGQLREKDLDPRHGAVGAGLLLPVQGLEQ